MIVSSLKFNGDNLEIIFLYAIKKYEEALTLFQQADYKPGKAFTFSAIVLLHEKSGEKLKALNYYSKALTLWQELKNLELQYDNLDAVLESIAMKVKELKG